MEQWAEVNENDVYNDVKINIWFFEVITHPYLK